jgi:hypothetical protein
MAYHILSRMYPSCTIQYMSIINMIGKRPSSSKIRTSNTRKVYCRRSSSTCSYSSPSYRSLPNSLITTRQMENAIETEIRGIDRPLNCLIPHR